MPIPSITFRVEANLLNDFKLVAKRNNRTATMLVRDFMLAYLKDDGEVWALNLLSDFNDVNEKGFDDKLSVKASKDLIAAFQDKVEANEHVYSEIMRCAIRKYLIDMH